MRVKNFGTEPENTLLSAEKVAIATIQSLVSEFTGQVIDVKEIKYENEFTIYYVANNLRACQLKQLSILEEMDRICQKHHLTYWLDGGTLLGACATEDSSLG